VQQRKKWDRIGCIRSAKPRYEPREYKHRLKEAADLCKQHLREQHRDQRVPVEEFIGEFEDKERDHTLRAERSEAG
jgi:hypothetical protein